MLSRTAWGIPFRRLRSYSTTAPLDPKRLTFKKTSAPKERPPHDTLVFGRTMTDHMLEADWDNEKGWSAPVIKAYEDLRLSPAALCLHYALECFEGMKAYKDAQGRIRLFRPLDNMQRMNSSAERLSLPTYEPEAGVELIKEYVRVEKDWIPQQKGCSLYLRPTMIATQGALGVQASMQSKWYVISCPVGPYYKSGFKPVALLADDQNVRAWTGGVGQFKVGGNYAPGIVPQREAAKRGYAQILWLFGPNKNITEVGTMNMFVYWKDKNGNKELVTAPLDGTILPGVTRSSVIDLAKDWGINVQERYMGMNELLEALREDRVFECFGAGTACVISPINGVHFQGKDYQIPLDPDNSDAGAGPLAQKFSDTILAIQYGEIEHPWSVIVD